MKDDLCMDDGMFPVSKLFDNVKLSRLDALKSFDRRPSSLFPDKCKASIVDDWNKQEGMVPLSPNTLNLPFNTLGID
jgi:hypothetical protein